MQINKENVFFALLLVLSACFFSLSYNIESRALAEAVIQSGQINYPDEFNLYRAMSMNSWSLPIQIVSFLLKINISPLVISKIIIFTTTLMFLIGVYLITRSLTESSLLAFLVSFLIILLKKNFGDLDYPTLIFSEHTNGLMAQAMSTLVFGFLINNNLKLGFFFSIILIPVHLTVGLWVNFMIFLTLILRIKMFQDIILNKGKIFIIFLALTVVLISFFYFFTQKLPLDLSYDDSAYKTYMEVWDSHRTGYGLYSNLFGYKYITKTLILVLFMFILLRLKLKKNNFDFGISVLFINCISSFFLYIIYKYFYSFFPDIVTRIMPTRFFLLHSVIGWPIIFSILYILIRSVVLKFNFNLKYTYYFFILVLIFNFFQHYSNFAERYQTMKSNLLISNKNNSVDEFWYKIKEYNLNGFVLTSSGYDTCVKSLVLAKKPLFFCPGTLDLIPYLPHAAGYVKKIVEEVFNIPFDNPKVKHLGGIHNDDLKLSFENRSYNDWIDLKNQFDITGLIIPKEWQIELKILLSNSEYNFYIIQ